MKTHLSTRMISLLLAVISLFSLFPVSTSAASSLDDAMAEIDIYARNEDLNWLTMNGSIKTQHYTYYNYTSVQTGQTTEIPAYCVDPKLYGVPALVPEGTPIKYGSSSTVSDPKVCGILGNGYPHENLSVLKVNTVEEAYYATKTALWIYLLGNWSINGLGINPNLTGADKEAAQRVLDATKWIYYRGMEWTELATPKLTATPDRDKAYPVTINGEACYQQIFTIESGTWSLETIKVQLAAGAPAGTKIMDMDDKEIDSIAMPTNRPYQVQIKVVYPASSIEGESGTVQLNLSSVVVQYAIYYATSLETNQYGEMQDYMLDTDPHLPIAVSAISRYSVDPDNPDDPEEPDEPGDGGLRIRKYETGTNTPLEGAIFEVIGPNGDVVGSFSTNSQGIINLSGLEPGNYTVTELTPPKNHRLPERTTQNVTVKEGETAELSYWNDPFGNLRVEKVSDTGEPLEGVTIQIKHIATGATQSGQTGPGGAIEFTELTPGGYEVRELAGIKGWIADTDTVKTVAIVTGETSTVTFTNKEAPGLRIIKYDRNSHQHMEGVTFAVYRDNEFLGNYTTDPMGEILIVDAQPGTYRVFEVDTGDDGHILDTTPQEIELKAGDGILELVFFNDRLPGIHLIKVDSSNLSRPIANVKFSIEAVNGSFGPEEFTTDQNGQIDLSKMPTGAYVVTEIECPGYVIDEVQRIIQLNANETAQFVFTNSKRPTFTLVKLDSYDSSPLGGVTFRIAKIEDGTHYLDRVTDINGEIHVEDLDPGVYSVTEIDVPEGYVKNDGEWHVELFPGKDSTLVVTNDRKPDLTIRKTDKDTGEPVPGVTFTLRKADGPTITTEPTGADGTVTIHRLDPGVYTVTEQSVPEGYILDTTPQNVTLFPNRNATVQFQNYKRPTLKIAKVDINGKFLPGAIFEVKTKAGVKIGDFPVGPDGTVTIPNIHLDEGYYIITEIQAPEGYILDKTPHEVYLRPGKTTESSIENEKKPGLTIYKIDSVVGDGVKGAKFKIYVAKDKTQNGTYQELDSSFYYTDENGIIHLDGLDTGWYKIVEVEPPAGYMLKDPSEQIIYVEHDKAVEVTFENIPKSALVIRKIDAATGAPLANAWFRVRYLGGTSGSGGTIIGEYATSSNGNIIITGLDAGTYVVEEISAPNGYVIDTAPQTAYISGKEQDCITLTFTNSKYGSLLIKKVDSVTGEPLSDIQFFVTDSDGSVVGNSNGYFTTDRAGTILVSDIMPGTTLVVKETQTKPGYVLDDVPQTIKIESNETKTLEFRNQPLGSLLIRKVCAVNPSVTLSNAEFKVAYSDGTLIGDSNGVYRSDENGEVRISGLIPGKSVVVTETKAPAGFIIDTQSQTAVIQSGKTVTLTFKNQPKGGIIIQKRDSITGQPLPGAQFRVTTAAGCEVGLDGVIGSSTLTQNGIFTTDSSGEIRISNLAPGAYVLTEIKAPAGYVMDSPSTNVVIGANGDTQTVIVTNTPKGGLIVEKYDSVTKQPLADAEFKITTANGELVADNEGLTSSNGLYTTDVNGQIILSKLLPGTYVVTETRAPDNYQIDPKSQTVVVNAGDTQTIRFYDDPLCTLTILKRDAVTRKPLAGATFSVRDSEGRAIGPNNGLYTTGSDGTVTVSGLTPNATIVVSETKAPTGYILDETPKTIVVRSGVANSLIFDNQPGTTLVIRKYIEGTDYEPLAGVCFKVTDGSGAAVGPDDGVYYTDLAGEIVLEGIEPGTTVIAREIKTVEGYVLDGTPQDILIKGGEVQRLTFWNKKAGTLVIQKKDSVSGALISGAQFQLTYASGGYVDNDNGHLSSNGLYTTDANGEIRISGITGTVVAKEVQAAPGYVIDSSTQTQTVTVNPMDTQTLVFLNEPLCSLTLTKLDSVTGKPVPGTEFTVTDGNGNVIGRYVTGTDGTVVVTGLIPGNTYVVYESRVPDGYVLDSTPQTITVTNGTGNSFTSGGTNSGNGTGTGNGNGLTFENDPKMTLTIHKYIEGTANEPLAGVAFKVVDGSGAPLNPDGGIYYTNSAGEIVLEGLEPGMTIMVQEIKTVNGYVLDGNPQSIKIEAGKAQNLTFWNKPAGSLVIRKLDKLTGKPLAGVEFEAMYAEGGYVDTANGHLSSNGLYYTDDHGEIHISGIVGTIVVKETRPLPGYTIEPGREQQIVTVNPQETQTLTFLNVPANTLTIQKYIDGTNNEPLSGVEFLVTDSSGAVVGPNNGYYTTDKDGRISISGLTPGTSITVRETKTVDGYVLDGNPQTILIKEGEAQSLTFWNKKAGGLIVNKIDAVTKEPLAGVKFRITYADGSNVDMDGGRVSSNGIYTTDSTGQIKILGIVGTVIVEEIETIPGYIIDPNAKSQTVQINPNDTQTITFTNAPKQTLIIQKLVTGTNDQPLAGVEFLVTDSSGAALGPNGGIYRTDAQGRITITDLTPGTVITAKETKTVDGYVLDSTPQSREIKSGEVQTMTFYNLPVGGLELIKVSESDKSRRIPGVTFEIRKMDGGLVTTVTTDSTGRVHADLDAGDYYAVEIEAAQGFKLDATPTYFTVQDGRTTTVTITNKPFSGILIHKTDSVTGKGIYGVTFLLYDSTNTPIGQYTSDNSGYVYIENLTVSGRYYLRELENQGYIPDTQMKTVYVTAGETTLIEWKNTPITAQIQITKKSADYNPTNGLPAGTLLEGAIFEIYDKANNLVDTIQSDSRGLAVSKPLPLGRYTIREVKAPDYYGISGTDLTAYLEHEGEIVRFEVTNKALATGVSITKTGPAEAMAGQPVRYVFSDIANSSNVRLDNFYWRDTLPAEVRLDSIVTGTYNFPGVYKITYRVNGGEYRTLADNLSTQKNYTLAASATALGLASNERVTEIMFVFGQAPAGFAQVEKPYLYCTAIANIASDSFVNVADVGGTYNGVWVQAVSRWVTKVYGKPVIPTLPRTGY